MDSMDFRTTGLKTKMAVTEEQENKGLLPMTLILEKKRGLILRETRLHLGKKMKVIVGSVGSIPKA